MLEKTITATGTGTEAAPKTAAITLAAATANSAVKASNIVAAEKASAKLYSDTGFTTEAGTDGIALTVGETKTVYILVTAEDGTKLYYKVSIALPQTVTGYSLKASESGSAGAAASGVILAYATKLDGKVTLKLGGTLVSTYVYTADGSTAYPSSNPATNFDGNGTWIGNSPAPTPVAGKYSDVYINGLFPAEIESAKYYAIKNTNQALRFFTGSTALATAPLNSPATEDTNSIYIPTTTDSAVRWKVYGQNAINSGDTLGILIWNGGTAAYTPKTATLEIQEYSGNTGTPTVVSNGYSATVIVDFSDVNFGS